MIGLYSDELETYWDNWQNSPFLVDMLVAIILYVKNVVKLAKSWSSLQRLLHKLYEFYNNNSSLDGKKETKILIFGCNKRKLNQEAFWLDNEQIEITYE